MAEKENKNKKKNKNIHAGHRERMRSRFLKKGINGFNDHEILEFLLYYVYSQKNTNPIGHELIKKFNTLESVFSATYEELCSVDGVGPAGAVLIMMISQLRNRIGISTAPKIRLANQSDAGEFCLSQLKDLTVERMILISLKSTKDVIAVDIISEGGPNSSSVDVRKIVETAMLRKASAVIIAHNHPGDSTHPSASDIAVTAKIISVLEGIDIDVIDHIICSNNSYSSMSERGLLDSL